MLWIDVEIRGRKYELCGDSCKDYPPYLQARTIVERFIDNNDEFDDMEEYEYNITDIVDDGETDSYDEFDDMQDILHDLRIDKEVCEW